MGQPRKHDREKIMLLAKAGKNSIEIGKLFGIHPGSVRRVISEVKRAPPTSRKPAANRTVAAPAGWCDLTRDGDWVRKCATDEHYREIRTRKSGSYEVDVSIFDPGAVYPVKWRGPLYSEIKVKRKVFDGCRRWLLTDAQNETPAIGPGLNSMFAYAQWLGAEIIVGQTTYNRDWYSAVFGGGRSSDHERKVRDYSSALEGLMTPGVVELGPAIEFHAEQNITLTSKRPLLDLNTVARGKSAIFSHPRQDLESVPRHPSDQPVLIATTGAITAPNYVDRKAGHIARFHHVCGFVIVEVDKNGDHWHRHVHMDLQTGRFQDLDVIVDGYGKITTGNRANLICADAHFRQIDKPIANATWFNPDSLARLLRPPTMVLHDTLDFWGQNHHNRHDPFHAWRVKVMSMTVEKELQEDADYTSRIAPLADEVLVAASNHPEALTRWLKETDYKHDQTNADVYLDLTVWMRKQIKANPGVQPNPHEYAIRARTEDGIPNVKFMTRRSKVTRAGVRIDQHGDKAPNGARGSLSAHKRGASKGITADAHSAAKSEGRLIVGAILDTENPPLYTEGSDTSWVPAHGALYPDGRFTHITMRKCRDGVVRFRGGDRRPVNRRKAPR